jgi:hypothetical protein
MNKVARMHKKTNPFRNEGVLANNLLRPKICDYIKDVITNKYMQICLINKQIDFYNIKP